MPVSIILDALLCGLRSAPEAGAVGVRWEGGSFFSFFSWGGCLRVGFQRSCEIVGDSKNWHVFKCFFMISGWCSKKKPNGGAFETFENLRHLFRDGHHLL